MNYGGFTIFYIAAAIIAAVCSVLTTRLTGSISQASIEFDTDVIIGYIITMAVITAVKVVTNSLSEFFTGRFSGRAVYKLRENFVRHFASMKFADFEKKNSGAVLSVYTNDLPQAASFITRGSLGLITEIISVLAVFIYMVLINPIYTLIFFAMFPLLIWLQIKISTPIQAVRIREMQEMANFNAVVSDSLQNTATVIAYSLEDAMEQRYLAAYGKYYKAVMEYIRALCKLVMTGQLATGIPMMFIYGVSAFSVINNNMTLGEFIAYTAISMTASNWLMMLSQKIAGLRVGMAGAVRLNENTAEEKEDIFSGEEIPQKAETAVKFNKVSFAYREDSDVLSDVSFEIKKGEKVALVGPSGSGKSTVLKLILSLYSAKGGEIYISGAEIGGVSKSSLRGGISYVPQDSYMFPGTIRKNLLNAWQEKTAPSEGEIKEACENAGILEFINELPEGLETILSESAENISGGQRQRIAIARAFLRDAPIVLLDEATSALDPHTEAGVLRALSALCEGRTAFMVAHRPKAIAACDKIMVFDGGKLTGFGTHAELIKANKTYAALYETMERESAAGREGGAQNA